MAPPASEISNAREYYRKILPFYTHESVARAHLAFWRTTARRLRPARILEIGSGLGRITAALAGVAPCVGIDVSLEMLGEARSARRRGLFVAADMRRPAFTDAFDLIVAPGDPFSHLTRLEDRRRALRAVVSQLAPGGHFVLEGLHRRRHEVAFPVRRIRHDGGTLAIEEAWFPAGVGDLWSARYRYVDRRSDGTTDALAAAFMARAWNRRTIRNEFAAVGLRIISLRGDFDGRPFRPGAPRLLVTAVRSR
jgi:SAM-dependent methyltransferase